MDFATIAADPSYRAATDQMINRGWRCNPAQNSLIAPTDDLLVQLTTHTKGHTVLLVDATDGSGQWGTVAWLPVDTGDDAATAIRDWRLATDPAGFRAGLLVDRPDVAGSADLPWSTEIEGEQMLHPTIEAARAWARARLEVLDDETNALINRWVAADDPNATVVVVDGPGVWQFHCAVTATA